MNKQTIILYWSDEDQAFVADVPELLGCMAPDLSLKAGKGGMDRRFKCIC